MQAGGGSNTQDEQHVQRAPKADKCAGMQAGGGTDRMNSMYREIQQQVTGQECK